jgi:hypothetical protein
MIINEILIKSNRLNISCAKNIKKTSFSFIRVYSTKKAKKNFLLFLCGAVIGLVNGFFGGGGGVICVPILEKFCLLDGKCAHASAIAVILPISIVSASIYFFNGFIETLPLLFVGLGFVVGGIIGSFVLKILPSKIIKIIFAIIMFVGGIKLIL